MSDWTRIHGSLDPVFDESGNPVGMNWADLGEDIHALRSADKRYVIDVGWWPGTDLKAGHFHCQVILRDDWMKPIDSTEAYDIEVVRRWVELMKVKYG